MMERFNILIISILGCVLWTTISGQYTVRLKTSACEEAGTDDDIYLDVSVIRKNSSRIDTISEKLAKSLYDDFEQGSDDIYQLETLKDDLQICSVSLRVKPAEFLGVGVRMPGDWRPEFVQFAYGNNVIASYNSSKKRCDDENTWIYGAKWKRNSLLLDMEGTERAQQCPDEAYTIRVRTSGCDGSGTDDDVYLKLDGYNPDTKENEIYSAKLDLFPQNDFELGSDDSYQINDLKRKVICSASLEVSKGPWRLGILPHGKWRPDFAVLKYAGKTLATYDVSQTPCPDNRTWYESGDVVQLLMAENDSRCPEQALLD